MSAGINLCRLSALANDFFSIFSLKLTFEIFHLKQSTGYLEYLLFSYFENELSIISTDYVEQQLNLSFFLFVGALKKNTNQSNLYIPYLLRYMSLRKHLLEGAEDFPPMRENSLENLRDFLELTVYEQIALNWCITANPLLLLGI